MIVLFCIGAGYAILSFILGDGLGVDLQVGEMPYLSPVVIATFLTVFGGVGYWLLRQTDWSALPVAGVSLLAGLGVSTVVLFLVVIPLQAAHKGDAPSAQSMIGMAAEVVIPIEPQRLGEIVYVQSGIRHNAPAKSASDTSIASGVTVRIVGESAGIFIVTSDDAKTVFN
jgi:membrane-bound ClpP family serine protease